ncbi:MAG TPA: dipeptidase PepE [Planctomycetota bacterium]|nr:dipeptidase PepE [Planctomycetota bacterium]
MRLLLISNSTQHGGGWLDHCAGAIEAFLGRDARRILFVPFAAFDRAAYAVRARERFERMGHALESLHDPGLGGPLAALERAEAIFVGGGNTFRLLAALLEAGLLEPLRARAAADLAYIGASAGTNLACPTIQTTNDMPILWPERPDALGLVPFQINAHYVDPDPASTHMGETREQRIAEFLEHHARPVVGLREGSWLRREGSSLALGGARGARLFRRGSPPEEFEPGARLDALLQSESGGARPGPLPPERVQLLDLVLEKIAAHPSYSKKLEEAVAHGEELVLDYHTHGPGHGYCVSIGARPPSVAGLDLGPPRELAHVRGVGREAEECRPLMGVFASMLRRRYGLASEPAIALDGQLLD